jgi:hypothetical protein
VTNADDNDTKGPADPFADFSTFSQGVSPKDSPGATTDPPNDDDAGTKDGADTKAGADPFADIAEEAPPPPNPLENLVERVKADPRELYRPEVLEALLNLEENDPVAFSQLHWDLTTKANVGAQQLRSALSRVRAARKRKEKEEAVAADLTDTDLLVRLGRQAQYFIDIDNRGLAFAEFTFDGTREVAPIKGSEFRDWLTRAFLDATRHSPARESLIAATDTLQALAKRDAPKCKVFVRVGHHEGKIYLDRGTPERDAIEIDADGYRCVAQPPVKFVRPESGFGTLPIPEPGGSIDALKTFLHLARPRDFDNAVGWVIGCYQGGKGQLTHLFIGGTHGSAKSTTLRFLLGLVDPVGDDLPGAPQTERDLWVVARSRYVMVGDNLKYMSLGMTTAMCLLSNGGVDQRRSLYTNAEESAIRARRPCAMTSTKSILQEADLLDRTTVILASGSFDEEGNEDKRRPLEDLADEYAKEQPKLLGAVLGAVSEGLRRQQVGEPSPKGLPRMADYARWVFRCAPGLGWRQDRIFNSYWEAIRGAAQDLCETDILAAATIEFAEEYRDGWEGSATDLMSLLRVRVGARIANHSDWPLTSAWLSRRLVELSPMFNRLGLRLTMKRTNQTRSLKFHWDAGHQLKPPGEEEEEASATAAEEADGSATTADQAEEPVAEAKAGASAAAGCPSSNRKRTRI